MDIICISHITSYSDRNVHTIFHSYSSSVSDWFIVDVLQGVVMVGVLLALTPLLNRCADKEGWGTIYYPLLIRPWGVSIWGSAYHLGESVQG